MTDAAADRARWASAFADELAGFAPGPYPDVPDEEPEPVAPATRQAQARADARARAQRARDRARRDRELDAAIVAGMRAILRARNVLDRLIAKEDMAKMAVRIEPIFAEAMTVLTADYGWDRAAASKALTVRLLR